MRPIRVASVQFESVTGNKTANLATVRSFTEKAAPSGAKIVAFPECCLTGYWFLRKLSREQLLELAEPVPAGPASRELLVLAKQYDITVGAGLIEVADDGLLYNTYVVAMPDGLYRAHRKMHAFVSRHISSGSAYTVFDTPHGYRVGVLICYDNNIGENVRINALLGADIIIAPHQTGGCRSLNPNTMGLVERRLWENRKEDPAAIEAEFRGDKGRGWLLRWLPARAYENGVYYVFSNPIGWDYDTVKPGLAMILDPFGEILVESDALEDDVVVGLLTPEKLEDTSGERYRKARRPELYGPLVAPQASETLPGWTMERR